MDKIKTIIKKFLTKEVLFYIIFGIITTIVNIVSFYIMANILKWEENLSNFLAIILSILVAYITNRNLVFHSEATRFKEKMVEFFKFIFGRAFTMLIEFGGGIILFKLPIPNIIIKAFLTVLVIILNFIISKFYTFKKQ